MRPVVVVGGGIVGLATAYSYLRRNPGAPLVLLEKERSVAAHQTGHNSGVIHSGIYYRPGSRKARLCRDGRALLLEYLRDRELPHRVCGKLIVATRPVDRARLLELERRGRENGVPGVEHLDSVQLHRLDPEVGGFEGLLVPGTAIVDYRSVAEAFAADVRALGGDVRLGTPVERITVLNDGVEVGTPQETIEGGRLVNAAGLQADRLARLSGLAPPCRIVAFRGEHYTLSRRAAALVPRLLYPVPDPDLPFLGVHLTPRVDGTAEAGPNAVLAGAREGYCRSDLDPREMLGWASYPGFYRMGWAYWPTSVREGLRSLSRGMFLADLQRLLPALTPGDLGAWGAGVRAQALGPNGELIDDFLVVERPRALHVLNAPSPAATSALAIADDLVARLRAIA